MTLFRRIFCCLFRKHRADNKLPDDVDSSEPLSRFVFQSNHINRQQNRLHTSALLPVSGPHGLETSVCRTEGLNDAAIWKVGIEKVGSSRAKVPSARGDFYTRDALARQLRVVSAKEDFPEHAVVIG